MPFLISKFGGNLKRQEMELQEEVSGERGPRAIPPFG